MSETETVPSPEADGAEHLRADSLDRRLAEQPREVGVLLVTIGIMGVVLPGLVGAPALLAGGLMLWPKGFRSVDRWLAQRCPGVHRHGTEQLLRYLDDMERRYPTRSGPRGPEKS